MALTNISTEYVLEALGLKSFSGVVEESGIKFTMKNDGLVIYNSEKMIDIGVSHESISAYFDSNKPGFEMPKEYKALVEKLIDAINFLSPKDAIKKVLVQKDSEAVEVIKKDIAESKTPQEIMAGEKVFLKDAVEVYQPVKSTSPDSKYFVVAIGKDLKIAARVKIASVSVRVEGDLVKYKSQLVNTGYDMKTTANSYTHASLHVSCGGFMRFKVVGSALHGLLIGFDKIAKDLQLLDGKGV